MQLWFYAIFLFTTTRYGVSAKELQRQLGVTYKCAHHMATRIRKHMVVVDGEGEFVQIDETYVGGKAKGKRGRGATNKIAVLGMIEPDGKLWLKSCPTPLARRYSQSLRPIRQRVENFKPMNGARIVALIKRAITTRQ